MGHRNILLCDQRIMSQCTCYLYIVMLSGRNSNTIVSLLTACETENVADIEEPVWRNQRPVSVNDLWYHAYVTTSTL